MTSSLSLRLCHSSKPPFSSLRRNPVCVFSQRQHVQQMPPCPTHRKGKREEMPHRIDFFHFRGAWISRRCWVFDQWDLWNHLCLLTSPHYYGIYIVCSHKWALFSSHLWKCSTDTEKQSSLNTTHRNIWQASQADPTLTPYKIKNSFTYHVTLGYTRNTCNVQTHCNLNRFSCGGKKKKCLSREKGRVKGTVRLLRMLCSVDSAHSVPCCL